MKHIENCVGMEVRTLNNMLFRTRMAYEASRGVDEVTVMHGWIIGFIYENSSREIFQKDIEPNFLSICQIHSDRAVKADGEKRIYSPGIRGKRCTAEKIGAHSKGP